MGIAGAAADDQREAIAFLRNPASHGAGVNRVDIAETHISLVFLAGERAYKLKRAVRLPYLDFSTIERRRQACEAELALNRRTAPEIYLEVARLTRNAEGVIGFSAAGETLDWVVVMRRFDEALLFDSLAGRGALDAPLMDALADTIARFHAAAERSPAHGGAAQIADIAETQYRSMAAVAQAGFVPEELAEIREKWREATAEVAALLDARRAAGKVRLCHGDLHLRNICLFDGRPTLFDCLEFDTALATTDVLYDLAFLLMDLDYRGLSQLANRVFNRYLDRNAEDDGLAALPLFLSLRAGIRAQAVANAAAVASDAAARRNLAADARGYLGFALRLLRPQPPRMVAVGGASGSGKSTLAIALASELGLRPGARVLRSDVTRKLSFGVAPESPLPADAYTPEASRRVYDALRGKAAAALAAGYSAIVDAVSLYPDERASLAAVAQSAGVPFAGLWLDAPPAAMADRIRTRRHDASDATATVLARQLALDTGAIDWVRIDAGGGPEHTLAAARRVLGSG